MPTTKPMGDDYGAFFERGLSGESDIYAVSSNTVYLEGRGEWMPLFHFEVAPPGEEPDQGVVEAMSAKQEHRQPGSPHLLTYEELAKYAMRY